MKSILDLTAGQLRRAARIQEKIDFLKWDLKSILDGADFAVTDKGGKRVRSEATKAKIAAIARERWRKAKAAGRKTL
jgi:hypothetical protein